MNWSKAIYATYAVLFAVVTVWAGLFFLQMHRELTALRAQEEANRLRLAAAEAKLRDQQAYLERLRHDPDLVERLIRRKLGYVKPQEFVFRFEEEGK